MGLHTIEIDDAQVLALAELAVLLVAARTLASPGVAGRFR